MIPFQKLPLVNLVLHGIADFQPPLEACSAQAVLAALMLHHLNLMQQVFTDLSALALSSTC
jgi:hypothetical protein